MLLPKRINLRKPSQMLLHILISLPHGFLPLLLLLLSTQFYLLASHHPQIPALLPGHDGLLLKLLIGAHEHQRIVDEVLFDVPVQGCVGGEGRSVVYLQDEGLQVFVDYHVETQDLEAHV